MTMLILTLWREGAITKAKHWHVNINACDEGNVFCVGVYIHFNL